MEFFTSSFVTIFCDSWREGKFLPYQAITKVRKKPSYRSKIELKALGLSTYYTTSVLKNEIEFQHSEKFIIDQFA